MYSLSTEQLCNLAIKEYEMYRKMDTLCSVTLTDKDWKMFALTMRCLFFIQFIKSSSEELTIDKVTEINSLTNEWLELYVSKNLNGYLPYWWNSQFERIFVVLCKSLKMREFKVALQILVDFVALMLQTLNW